MILITSLEHGVATAARDITVGAKAVEKFMAGAAKDAPAIEALTALIDPRAVVIERIGAALLGELQPQVERLAGTAGTVSTAATTPSFTLSLEAVQQLEALFASMKTEIGGVKATVAAAKAS